MASATQPDLSKITVGNGGAIVKYSVTGTITQLSDTSMKVKALGSTTVAVAIDPSTKFQIAGALKDSVTVQQEFAAYNAQVGELMKDPVKNQTALAALQLPSTQTMAPTTLSDFKVGDQVLVEASSATSNGVLTAAIITKSAATSNH